MHSDVDGYSIGDRVTFRGQVIAAVAVAVCVVVVVVVGVVVAVAVVVVGGEAE